MNTENIEELAQNCAKTFAAYIYKMTKILINNNIDENTALLIASAKVKQAVEEMQAKTNEEDLKKIIAEAEGKKDA